MPGILLNTSDIPHIRIFKRDSKPENHMSKLNLTIINDDNSITISSTSSLLLWNITSLERKSPYNTAYDFCI